LRKLVAIDDLGRDGRVVVACSGGADSLALLALSCAAGFDVVAVYVDHGLRDGSAHDANVVALAAASMGARALRVGIDVGHGSNLEARAREQRYAALEQVCASVDARALFVGHTRDDQAETVLLNLLRGSGIAGLAGAPAHRGIVRRPLLALRRADTVEICARLQLAPVADPMNDELHFRRVWLRRSVVPALERAADRDIVEVLARQADVLRDDNELLDTFAAMHDAADATALVALLPALARRVVRAWLGSPPPSLATVERVLAVARGDLPAAELPGGDRVELVDGRLLRIPSATQIDPDVPGRVRLPLPGRTRFADYELTAWIEDAAPVAWPDGRWVAVCDAERVTANTHDVVVRAAIDGERFRPLGAGGTKLVRDAQAEAGVPAQLRRTSPVVAAGGLVWVVGYRIDDRVRVSTQTRRFLWLSAEPGRS
jgi:tRNA(Ile)-lysidine synthase